MKRFYYGFMVVAASVLLLASCEKSGSGKGGPEKLGVNDLSLIHLVVQDNCGDTLTADLLAGKNTKVGKVRVTTSGGFLQVSYIIDGDGWLISETHLSVTPSLAEVPAGKDKNPKVGQFNYTAVHDPYVSAYTYSGIPVGSNTSMTILAHAVVKRVVNWKTDLPALDIVLPEYVKMTVSSPYVGSSSYFKTTVTEGGILDGVYDGWCIDVGRVIYPNTGYTARVVSSYNGDLSGMGLIDKPENLDKVNWIINQDFAGKAASDGREFTFGDVQVAIWSLIDNELSYSGLGPWSQVRVDEIISLSASAGEAFVPECGQRVAVVLVPVDQSGNALNVQVTIAQITIITFPGICKPVVSYDESAWAAGYDFGGRNWAKYFTYCITANN